MSTGTSICLSCLLERGRYDELQELLAIQRVKFWPYHQFGAEALVRQGLWEAAIAFAEAARSKTNPGYYELSIDRFCETLLLKQGRADEAYQSYGLRAANGTTNLSAYRALIRAYPDRDRRRMLLDLIETRDDKGKWFAAAKDAGFFDIAIECAAAYGAEPIDIGARGAGFLWQGAKIRRHCRTACSIQPSHGGGYDPRPAEAADAVKYLLTASREIAALDWALGELSKLAAQQCAAGREPFQAAIKTALAQWQQDENKA